jgi:hypothetical protein
MKNRIVLKQVRHRILLFLAATGIFGRPVVIQIKKVERRWFVQNSNLVRVICLQERQQHITMRMAFQPFPYLFDMFEIRFTKF